MPTNVIMPQMGESIAEGTITKWMKKVGEHVDRDEPLFEISTDKVDAEIPSPAAGVLTQILVRENETVVINTVVAIIDGDGTGVAAPAPAEAAAPSPETPSPAPPALAAAVAPTAVAPPTPEEQENGEAGEVRTSPLVRRIAREHNVDLSEVKGTGLGGRVSKKDILDYLDQRRASAPSAPPLPAAAPAPVGQTTAPSMAFTGATQIVPMTPMRQKIAEHMVMSKHTSAHVYTVVEVEMTRVVATRERCKQDFEQRNGIKLTFTPFFIRAAVEAIKELPIINSSVDGTNIIYKRDVNIGLAVALENGLIVPVIKRADEKNFLGVARAVQDLADRARSKRLSVDDVQGGTFTITNPGSFGGLFGLPIINQPQVAILGVGAIEKRPVVRDDAIAIRHMAYLSISYDHRVIDGAVAERFMGKIKQILENWEEAVL
ncbi:MAG TPA: dihydrolipoyllysine-residue succinyltransferase [Terriglobia bacterium]|nr:dihydrolipoyllysine-residue succinyltransferase [Terriglobia bacterium]